MDIVDEDNSQIDKEEEDDQIQLRFDSKLKYNQEIFFEDLADEYLMSKDQKKKCKADDQLQSKS